jgi:hypothetical protein
VNRRYEATSRETKRAANDSPDKKGRGNKETEQPNTLMYLLKISPVCADIDIQRLKEKDALCDIMDMINGWYSGKNLNLL